MKVTKEQMQANRRRIVENAAALFRDRGFDGIGLADLMKASGLTHGGFYRHFASKDDLMAEAAKLAHETFEQENGGKPIEALLTRYISPDHRDELATACPTSALGVDAMRQASPVRTIFADGVQSMIDTLAGAIEDRPGLADKRALAIDLAARAVGAIVLARAASADTALSDEILKTVLDSALAAAERAA